MSRRDVTEEIIEKILLTAATGATIVTSLALPGAIIGLGPLIEKAYKLHDKRQQNREYRRVLAYMKHQRMLKLKPRAGNGLVITKRGNERLRTSVSAQIKIKTPKVWDKSWRLVFFDIPETKRQARRQFVERLQRLGFYQLQRSAWIHPFPCRKVITQIALEYSVANYVAFLTAAKLDNDTVLKKQFKALAQL